MLGKTRGSKESILYPGEYYFHFYERILEESVFPGALPPENRYRHRSNEFHALVWNRFEKARLSSFEEERAFGNILLARVSKLSLLAPRRRFIFTQSESKCRLPEGKCTSALCDATFTFHVRSLRFWHFTPSVALDPSVFGKTFEKQRTPLRRISLFRVPCLSACCRENVCLRRRALVCLNLISR